MITHHGPSLIHINNTPLYNALGPSLTIIFLKQSKGLVNLISYPFTSFTEAVTEFMYLVFTTSIGEITADVANPDTTEAMKLTKIESYLTSKLLVTISLQLSNVPISILLVKTHLYILADEPL